MPLWHRSLMRRCCSVLLCCLVLLWALRPAVLRAEPVARVVALAPSLAELVYALDAGPLLVGRTQHSNTPDAVRSLPAVGPYFRPDIERIMALRPDLCLAIHDGTPQATVHRLRQLGVPVLELAPDTFEGLELTLLKLGQALGTGQAAARAAANLRERLATVDSLVRNVPETDRPVVLLQVQAMPPMFAGQDTFCGELIRRAGGRNPVSSALPYPLLDVEDVLALQPEIILIPDMARAGEAKKFWQRFPAIPAVRNNRVYVVSADLFSQPTLRSLDALEHLHGLLYPSGQPDRQAAQP